VGLFEGLDDLGRITPRLGFLDKGPQAWDVAQNTLDTQVNLGTTEMWAIYNTTIDAHPVHLHETSFQVVGRQPFTFATDPGTGDPVIPLQYQLTGPRMAPAANEAGWKDTVRALPGEVTYVVAKFDLLGEYVWHCHILSHEDNEMMLAYRIVTGGAPAPTYVPPTP
jgi:spore coat protein A, manganese oxidase